MILDMLLSMEIVGKIVFNTILVSIPEELFLVLFTYILMGEFDHWKDKEFKKLFYKWDFPRIFVPVLVSALLSNIFRYTGVSSIMISLGTLLPLFICIIITGDITNNASAVKWVGKALVSLLIGVLTVTMIEILYIPFILYGTGLSVQEINNSILLNFLIILPERVIEFFILLYFIASKRTFLKANFIKIIFENRVTATVTLIIMLIDVCFLIFMVQIIGYQKALVNFSTNLRITVILGICMIPILNISALVGTVYFIKNNFYEKQKEISDQIDFIINSIKRYTDGRNYDNIKWDMNEWACGLEKVSNNLFKKEEI